MKTNSLFKKLSFSFVQILILFIPFQNLISELLSAHTNISSGAVFWLVHWYEPFLIIFFLISLFDKKLYQSKINIVLLLLIFLGSISVLFTPVGFRVGLEGFRFTLLPLLVFFVASSFEKDQKEKILRVYFILSLVIAIWALLERFLPENYWVTYKIVSSSSSFGGLYLAGSIRQASSLIGAPNQLASYLLPAFFIALFGVRNKAKKYSIYLYMSVILIAIILTFSRSAILGLSVGLLVYLIFFVKSRAAKSIFSVAMALAAAIIIHFYQNGPLEIQRFLTHGTSQSLHYEALQTFKQTFERETITQRIFGRGIGTAGPIALKYNSGVVPESWYLQLVFEIGLIGLLLWFLFLYLISKQLFRTKPELVLGLISISVTALFLHTWADNPAMAYSILILLGIYETKSKDKKLV